MKKITMDFETRSMCELKKAGAYKYSLDPSTAPTCLALKEHGVNTVYFLDFEKINTPWAKLPGKFKVLWQSWLNDGYLFCAHNAFFETCIYKNILVARLGWPDIPFRRFRCTAAKAAAYRLPRALGDAGMALELKIQKDKRGYLAMMATCKPTKRYNAWLKACAEVKAGKRVGKKKQEIAAGPPPPVFLEPEADPTTWDTLYTYCKFDVRSEEELDETLPDLLPLEQEIWFFNQQLNWRGLRFDVELVKKIIAIMSVEEKRHLEELDELTLGLIRKPGAVKSILEFLENEGVELPNLRAKTVDDQLKEVFMGDRAKHLLELRKVLSKTSTKKYQSFLARANADGRCRDILLYNGAGTGRDTGTGVQPHNFPRGLLKAVKGEPYFHVNNVVDCAADELKLLYGQDSVGILFSAILRNMIIPSEGKKLFVGDFSKIEVAVLWWLCRNEVGLKILRAGKDPYKYQAAYNLGVAYEDIGDDSDDRQLGKAQVLGNGFGMGWAKFQATAWDMYRLKLTDEQAKAAVANYRTANKPVKEGWKAAEEAAVSAIENPSQVYEATRCKFYMKGDFLHFELPSGRTLPHYKPRLTWRDSDYGPKKTIEYWGVNSKTKKWGMKRTWGGTIVQNCTQAVARDLMMPTMLRLEKAGYMGLLMVHDEGICESDKGSVEEFQQIMCEVPPWGAGLPIESKGWSGERYRK
jgi:DNA polymerase bacteriophage-type